MKKIYIIDIHRQQRNITRFSDEWASRTGGLTLRGRPQERRILIEGESAASIRSSLSEILRFFAPDGSGLEASVRAATKAWDDDGDGSGLPPAWWHGWVAAQQPASEAQ